MLYHPHLGEIRPLIQHTINKWPNLKSRCQSAEMILLNNDIRDRASFSALIDWQVKSQAVRQAFGSRAQAEAHGPDAELVEAWYHIVPQGKHYTCGCYDHLAGKGNRAAGRVFCKHTIAWLAYKEILVKRLNHHIQAHTVSIEHVKWDYMLAGEHMGIVMVKREEPYDWWVFAEDRSMAVFAHWLGRRQAELQEPIDILAEKKIAQLERQWVYYEEEATKRQPEEQATWNRDEWDHYFATGETPAMVKVYELTR